MKKSILPAFLLMMVLALTEQRLFAQDDEKVYTFVAMENPPSFPGGITKFYEFLGKNIKYPKQAMENNVQGTVKVFFIVEKDGSITNIEVPEKIGSGLDEEAMRVMRLSPKWVMGIQSGKPVRVKYNIPIKFSLSRRPKN